MGIAAPTSPDAAGWACTEYATGYRAKVSLVSKSMRVNFAPDELGRDSGLAATDPAVTQLGYNVYFPAPGYETLITHVVRHDSDYLDSDAVFGVRQSLVLSRSRGSLRRDIARVLVSNASLVDA